MCRCVEVGARCTLEHVPKPIKILVLLIAKYRWTIFFWYLMLLICCHLKS